ncbi:MAG: hypothetical protein H6833_00205 [Planctomycetes bacterium]|nr:hypothetical protein [Planctomycetota bacterium]
MRTGFHGMDRQASAISEPSCATALVAQIEIKTMNQDRKYAGLRAVGATDSGLEVVSFSGCLSDRSS